MTRNVVTAGRAPAETLLHGFSYDVSERTVVVVCLSCGWRHLSLVTSREDPRAGARMQALSHERRAHPGARAAADAVTYATRATRRARAG